MAINTRNKRAAVIGWGLVALVTLPFPDGVLSRTDRQQLAAVYGGIPFVPDLAALNLSAVAGTQSTVAPATVSQTVLTVLSATQSTLVVQVVGGHV